VIGEHRTCYVCGSAELSPKYVIDGFHLVTCAGCSLVFVKEKLSIEELDAYYAQDIVADNFVYNDPANLPNLNYYFYALRDLIATHKAPGRILDVGCASGSFLDVMEGWDCYGIEFAGNYADKAIAKYGKAIHCGTLEDYPGPDNYFDVITLQDVFDHVRDPLATLRVCHRLLKPNGLIIIKVHNISCLYAYLTGSRYHCLIPPMHLSYFNKRSLREALGRTGFRTLYHRFIGHRLSLKTVAYRLSTSGRKPGFFYEVYKLLDRSRLGNIAVPKNFRDIITIVAEKTPA